MKRDQRLDHKCSAYFVPDSIKAYKPFPGAKFYKHEFQIECLTCHIRTSIHCTNLSDALAKSMAYPEKPRFPHD